MKRSSDIGPVTLSLVLALWMSAPGCGKKSQPPQTEGTRAEAPARTPDTTESRGDTSHVTAVPTPAARSGAAAQTPAKINVSPAARPSREPRAAGEHLATNAPSKATGISAAAPSREPSTAPAPESAPVPAATPPPAQTTEATGGLDAGPRAADTPVDPALASKGKSLFNQKRCNTCHKMDVRLVGPPLGPVPKQRSAAWIIAMIQRPAEMTRVDPIAKQLFQEYKIQMVPLGIVSADEARALLEYIKSAGK